MAKFRVKTDADIARMSDFVSREPVLIFFVDGDDVASSLTEFGGMIEAANLPDDLKGFTACHAANVFSDLRTFEADGDKLRYHNLSDYFSKIKSGDVALAFFKPKIWRPEFAPLMQKAIAEYNGQNYNKWELFWFGVGDLLHVSNIFGNPAYNKNSVVCSQLAILIFKYIPELYGPVVGNFDISKIQPEELVRRIIEAFDFYYYTESQVITAPAI